MQKKTFWKRDMAVGVLKVVIDYYQKAISKFVPHYMRDYVLICFPKGAKNNIQK